MMACSQWREELADHALGGAASQELVAHVANCATCAGALAAWREEIGRIDTGVRQMTAVEPPADFYARVLGAVAEPGWFRGWRMAAVGVALAAVVVAVMLNVRARFETRRSYAAAVQLASWRPPTDVLLARPGENLLKEVPRLGKPIFEMGPAKRNRR
jgi:hypothetical protein